MALHFEHMKLWGLSFSLSTSKTTSTRILRLEDWRSSRVCLQILSWCSNRAFFLSSDKFLLINKDSFLYPKRFLILTLRQGLDIFTGTSGDKGFEVGTSEIGSWDCSRMSFSVWGRGISWWLVAAACSLVGRAEDFPRLYSLFKLSYSFWLTEWVLGFFPARIPRLDRLFHACLPPTKPSSRISTFGDTFKGILEVLWLSGNSRAETSHEVDVSASCLVLCSLTTSLSWPLLLGLLGGEW